MKLIIDKYLRMIMKNLLDPTITHEEVEFEMERMEAKETVDDYSKIVGEPYAEPDKNEMLSVFSEETGDDGTIFVDAPLIFGKSQSELCVIFRIETNNGSQRAIIENITTP
jgi:hypothetical protein